MKPHADVIAAAQAAAKKWRVPASVSLAQYGLESGWGRAVSGKFNFGGITAKVEGANFPHDPGKPLESATLCPTHEVVHGVTVACNRWFKDFASIADYFDHHARLIATAPVYAPAMAALDGTPSGLAKFVSLMGAHYATAPDYAHVIMTLIQQDGLTRYDVVSK
jgi:flagellum-specific peptidoglycan hydrolase FlgJ